MAWWPWALGCLDVERLIRANHRISPIIRRSQGIADQVHCANKHWLERPTVCVSRGGCRVTPTASGIPCGWQRSLAYPPRPLITYVAQGQIRHIRGDEVNTFGPGEAFVEGNQEGPHAVENIGDGPAVLFVAVASKQGLRTTNFVSSEP